MPSPGSRSNSCWTPRRSRRYPTRLLEAGAISVDVADAHAGTEQETPDLRRAGARARRWPSAVEPRDRAVRSRHDGRRGARPRLRRRRPRTGARTITSRKSQSRTGCGSRRASSTPIRVSARLWIVPSWHAPVRIRSAINIVLDPGLAFGTGSHPTTRLCLRLAGPAICSRAAASSITAAARAFWPSPQRNWAPAAWSAWTSIRRPWQSSRYNARAQSRDGNFRQCRRTASAEPADVVLANILSNPLKILAPLLAALTRARRTRGAVWAFWRPRPRLLPMPTRNGSTWNSPSRSEGWVQADAARRLK